MATLSWDTPAGRQSRLLGAKTRIGRAPTNEVCLADPGVSSSHAVITCENKAWILEDCGSRNGTYVNNERQSRYELHDGDLVRIGNLALRFRATGTAAARAPWPTPPPEPPPTVQQAPTDAVPKAQRAEELIRESTQYSRVSSVDSTTFWTKPPAGASVDPVKLARRLRASYDISRATAATLNPSEILDRVLTALFEIFERAERAFIVLVDPQSGSLKTAASKLRVARKADDLPISRTALEEAMRTRQALLCRDAAADERFVKAQSIMAIGIRSMMIAPLVFRDNVLGAVHVDSVTGIREFTLDDLELLSIAANQVAGCLANSQLHEKVVGAERLAAIGQTVAGLSHCVKNILQGIEGGAFILDKALQKDSLDQAKTGWDMVKRNNAFMSELVFDLLTYSKQRQPAYAPTDLNALCADVCALVAERAKSKGVALAFQGEPALGVAELDPKGIRRCVLNLVTNAIDACEGHDGAVTVHTRAPGDDGLVRIVIHDTGCGMPEQTLAKLFTVFFSTKGSKGTGLGLPVTKKIVEEHGGRIEVDSHQGTGTTFTISLPLYRARTEPKGP